MADRTENTLIFEKYLEIIKEASMPRLSETNIYDFYFLYTLSQTDNNFNSDRYKSFLFEEYSKRFKAIWLNAFKIIVYDQIQKYLKRGRVDDDFPNVLKPVNQYNFENLYYLMTKTYRSDMERRNDRWVMLADYLRQLSKESMTVDDIYFTIDRINNVVHNTGEIMLSKFQNSRELLNAFENSHSMRDIKEFRPLVHRELRKLV
jgi:hypothetical protein